MTLLPPLQRSHRVTAAPRFRRESGGLWLGLGVCLLTLFVLRHTERL